MEGGCRWGVHQIHYIKTKVVEVADLQVFWGMLKGDAGLKLFDSMVK